MQKPADPVANIWRRRPQKSKAHESLYWNDASGVSIGVEVANKIFEFPTELPSNRVEEEAGPVNFLLKELRRNQRSKGL